MYYNQNYLMHYGVKGMKWGVHRYQNADGSLTPEGVKRYDRDVRENLSRKKDNRIDVSTPDPKRWDKEDLERTKKVIDRNSSMVRELNNIERHTRSKKVPKRESLDLSNMSDKELRDQINRRMLEQQYTKLYSDLDIKTVSRGRECAQNILSFAGDALAVTSSALSIALAIKELKG